jgi:hypothetical protein
VGWPSHVRSTPELDRLRAQLSALMIYRMAAEVLAQVFPMDAGADPETLRRHTFKTAEALPTQAATKPPPTDAEAIVVTLDSTFIGSCEDGERHLEVRTGNVETASGGRQVFGAVARTDTDPAALIRRGLDALGRTDFLVNRRMNKSQQMRWSRRGADRLLQVRCAVYNGTLGTSLGQRFDAANDPLPQVAAAA